MTYLVERVARLVAAEIMELTADQRASFKFPDDANGDTIDRSMSLARKINRLYETEAITGAATQPGKYPLTGTATPV